MDIDLSFAPVENAAPKALSPEQIAAYNEEGYLKPFRIYGGAELERNRAYFDYLMAEMRVQVPDAGSYAINGYHTRCEGIYAMVTHPRILDLVEDLVGPDFLAWGTHFFSKEPGDPKHVHWHQDASYWPLTPARTVTVWLAIDDADEENACMQFLAGTHRQGHLPYHEPETPGVLNQELTDAEQYGEAVNDELKAGELSLHADMLAHGSLPNASSRRRCGLTIRYCPPEVVPVKPVWGNNAIACRGNCDVPHWHFPPPPQGNDLNPKRRTPNIGGN